jgi:hypothetical protein
MMIADATMNIIIAVITSMVYASELSSISTCNLLSFFLRIRRIYLRQEKRPLVNP